MVLFWFHVYGAHCVAQIFKGGTMCSSIILRSTVYDSIIFIIKILPEHSDLWGPGFRTLADWLLYCTEFWATYCAGDCDPAQFRWMHSQWMVKKRSIKCCILFILMIVGVPAVGPLPIGCDLSYTMHEVYKFCCAAFFSAQHHSGTLYIGLVVEWWAIVLVGTTMPSLYRRLVKVLVCGVPCHNAGLRGK